VESKLGPLGTTATEWPIVPAPGDYDDGEFGEMTIGSGNRSKNTILYPISVLFYGFIQLGNKPAFLVDRSTLGCVGAMFSLPK
jgi:hypothetical protein